MNRRGTTVYNVAGQAVATIDSLGNRTTSVYDATVDPLGNRTTLTCDAAGRVVRERNPLGSLTTK